MKTKYKLRLIKAAFCCVVLPGIIFGALTCFFGAIAAYLDTLYDDVNHKSDK